MVEENESSRSLCQKLAYGLSQVTVEPVLFLYMLADSMQDVSLVNLSLFKVCTVTLGYAPQECVNGSLNTTQKDQVHEMEADYSLYRSYLKHSLSVLVAFIIGSWSDQHNRKYPMLLGKAGFVVSTLVYLLNAVFVHWPPEMLLVGSAISGVTGGGWIFMAIVMSYLADKSSRRHRTTRYGLLDGAHYVASPIGRLSAAALFAKFGFVPVFAVALAVCVVNVVYVVLRIDTVTPPREAGDEPAPTKGHGWRGIVRWQHFRDCWRVCTRDRDGHKRRWLLLILLGNFILSIPGEGEGTVSYNFYNLHFGWDQLYYSVFISVGTALAVVGFLVLLPIMTEKAKLSDPLLEIISDVAKIINPFLIIFSTSKWMTWTAQAFTIFYCFAFPAIRSLASKIVSPDEVGKVFTVKGVSEALISLFASLMYAQVYKATLTSFPGAFYFLSIGCSLITLLIFIYIWADSKSDSSYERLPNDTEPPRV